MSKLNVLVYNGSGVSASSRDYTLHCLRTFLSHRYDVQLVTPKTLREEPWTDNCALLVFPGGRDLPYLFDLAGKPNRRIREYVELGGKYLGICAGAYYACSEIEFEKGSPLEVVGARELGFFKGLCRGTTFPGFEYETEAGARETSLALKRVAWRDHWSQAPEHCQVWYNGGGSFILDPASPPAGVQVLAEYEETEPRQVAGVLCSVGQGQALLWAVHPEHPSLDPLEDGETRQDKEIHRLNLVRGTLAQLGLDVSDGPAPLPKLLPLVLATAEPSLALNIASEITARGEAFSDTSAGLVDRNDTFVLHPASEFDALVRSARSRPGTSDPEELRQENKLICVYDEMLPLPASTPLFDIPAYFAELSRFSEGVPSIGRALIYGEVVTSTQTMLDKNDNFLSALPSGLVCLASHQVAGRGRGGNSWISPAGCLQFSVVTRIALAESSRIVFVQYLFGLAVVEAIRSHSGYERVGVCLKWPNDIYADMGTGEGMERYDFLHTANPSERAADMIKAGCGINTSNPKPTTSLNELVDLFNRRTGSKLASFTPELLLALILSKFDAMWQTFQSRGFGPFVDAYLRRWIHSDQRVTLETTNQPVRIVGITPDHGLLRTVAVNVDRMGNEVFGGAASLTGQPTYIDLQPDGNRFDLMKGMLYAR